MAKKNIKPISIQSSAAMCRCVRKTYATPARQMPVPIDPTSSSSLRPIRSMTLMASRVEMRLTAPMMTGCVSLETEEKPPAREDVI